jgi:hypothetical protein
MRDLTDGGLRRVKVLFYAGESDVDTLQNRIAACWTRDAAVGHAITHCELRFSDGYATSITVTANRVHYERRLHSRDNYTDVIEYHVTGETETLMQTEAQRLARDESVVFNYAGFMWNFVPLLRWWPVRRGMKQVFCSELVVYLLQIGGFLSRLDAATTSPMTLFLECSQDANNGIAHLSWNREYGKALKRSINFYILVSCPKQQMT